MKQHLIDLGIVAGGVLTIIAIYGALMLFTTSYHYEQMVSEASLAPYQSLFPTER